ncbi:MAG TPA: D-alanyl-D-alanine carboxypeptidase family protein [Symbiobacteriaceae bacterium]|nr:D-alanyl-D-alanine carboxypeptidase family protein [Symbiobacteriaceae bacterium]
MKGCSMRHLAALGAALLLWSGTAPALAHSHRWAPTPEMEDGARAAEPAAAPATAEPEKVPATSETTKAPAKAQAPSAAAPVAIEAPSAILIESKSGRVLFEKNAHERRNPASVTKIMTLIVAFDAARDGKVKMEDKVTISDEAARQVGTIIFADTGETFTLGELLKSVAVGSANDAAVAVGEHVAGSVDAFVQAMNAKAKALGMHDTQFQNPTGLSADGHFTSAYDIAMMSRYAANNYPELIRLTSIYGEDLQVPWRKNGPTFRLWNNNKLLTWYPGADGLKTGWTEAAGYCLAATAKKGDVRMISVIMGADTWKKRNAEAAKLLDYGFSNYTSVELAPGGKAVGMVHVSRGQAPTVAAVPQAPFAVSVAKGEKARVKHEVKLTKKVEAPVQAGQVLGEIVAMLDGKEIGKMDLVAAAAVPKANLWQTILLQMKGIFGGK